MTTGLTDQERSAIEDKITRLYHDLQAEAANLDADGVFAFTSDAYKLGIMSNGVFYATMDSYKSLIRDHFSHQERLEEEVIELRAVALAPNAAVLVVEKTFTFYGKDGSTYTSPIVQTYVGAEVDGEWKFIHVHMSTPRRSE